MTGRRDEATWKQTMASLRAGDVVHAATAAAAVAATAATVRRLGLGANSLSAEEMKSLQGEVRHIAQLSVDALSGTALELDAIHQRQTTRLKRSATAEQPLRAAPVAEVSLHQLEEELRGIQCICCAEGGEPPAAA
eukprot:5579111-Prymnesium_polylepis.1